MLTYKEVWFRFKEFAFEKGYTVKVVGDNSFRKPRGEDIIRLISAKNDDIIVFESGVGRYSINQ